MAPAGVNHYLAAIYLGKCILHHPMDPALVHLQIQRFEKDVQWIGCRNRRVTLARVKEVTTMYANDVSRWTAEALTALQEDYKIHLFEDTNLCAIHAKRVTIRADLQSVSRLRGVIEKIA
uniref:Core Histone H2A/H2B/H3 domain-containing protein n=1 Tax=Physcomitrium patens TaxID=3218 RepID=A0A2K1JX95_PHYPA|nr:hypothetical protein PHYPA_013263 [Physcomitrium patens]